MSFHDCLEKSFLVSLVVQKRGVYFCQMLSFQCKFVFHFQCLVMISSPEETSILLVQSLLKEMKVHAASWNINLKKMYMVMLLTVYYYKWLMSSVSGVKAVLHYAIFCATCLAILLWYKLHGVTYPAIIKSQNIFVAASVGRSRIKFYFSQRLPQHSVAALRVCKRCAAPGPMARGGPSKPQNY